MELLVLNNGMFGSNSYILLENDEALLIDAGASSGSIIDTLKKRNLNLKYVLLTHGHIDHICSADEIRENTGAKVLIHEYDADCMTDGKRNLSTDFLRPMQYKKADRELEDGEEIEFGSHRIQVIHTPGHSKGGCCFYIEDRLFSGDSLFAGSIGRTDFSDGDYNELISSIKSKLLILPDNTLVYPGHGSETTIGIEKVNNPFLII